MKFSSKIFAIVLSLLATGVIMQAGCQVQQPTATAVSTAPTDQTSLFIFTSANVGLVEPTPYTPNSTLDNESNPNLYHSSNEPAVSSGTVLAKVSDYAAPPITVVGGPLPFTLMPATVPYTTYNPEVHPYVADHYYTSAAPVANNQVWPVWDQYYIEPTGLSDPTASYCVSIVGYINDPEDPAYPPGPGNIDPVAFEYFPYCHDGQHMTPGYNGMTGCYDMTPYEGFQFYVYINPVDSAIERDFLVNTYQSQPNNTSGGNSLPGGCNNPATPFTDHCYDSFQYDFTNTPKGQWVLIQKKWGDFKQFGFGSTLNPATLTGINLQQLQFFQWVESNAAQAGPVTVNFCLAGMRYF